MNTAVSSQENKIIITDEFRLSAFDLVEEEKMDTSAKEDRESIKEDSLCEYRETESSPQFLTTSSPAKETVIFGGHVIEEEKEEPYVKSKFDFITAQLPLHSISEDVNSPYFASSPSNITGYVRRQSGPNQENSSKYGAKFS